MPALVKARGRGFKLLTLDPTSPKGVKVAVPERIAKALKPEMFREDIPARVTLSMQAPPYSGELREEMYGELKVLPANGRLVIASLRRAWNYIGFSVDPGKSSATITAALMVEVRGMKALVPGSLLTITPGTGPVAQLAELLACRCQLVVFGQTGEGAVDATGVRGTIWGMSST